MKNMITSSVLALATTAICSCQEVKEREYTITASVADSDGKAIQGAEITAGKVVRKPGGAPWQGEPVRIDGVFTDSNGTARIAFRSLPEPGGNFSVVKDGYYLHAGTLVWEANPEKGGESRKAGISAILKDIRKPVAMSVYTMGTERIIIPDFGADYGYDMEAAQFVAPHGKGKRADIIFHASGTNDGKGNGKVVLTVKGAGTGDGFVAFSTPGRETGSRLLSHYEAPPAGYSNALTFTFDSGEMVRAMNQPKDGNLYFRLRTELDGDGAVKSAHYGKIYGPFALWGIPADRGGVASFSFGTSYFNPTPNDRNVECDTRVNLLGRKDGHGKLILPDRP